MDVDPAGHLDAARSAVLGRLWGALAREPIPGIASRSVTAGALTITLAGGRELTGPVAAAEPFSAVPPELTIGGHRDPADLVRALGLGPPGERLAGELADSVANLALARAGQSDPDGGPPYLSRRPELADLEQCVVDGHPLHPLCRTRTGLSPDEVRRYAPERRPLVALAVYQVPAERWLSTGSGLPPRLLVHPWQAEHVLPGHPALLATGELVPARPLMSLRTLVPCGEPGWHVKTAVDVQMTSAVRTVSPAAVHNGPVLSALAAKLGAPLGIQVLCEPAAGAVLVDGQPSRSLAMIRRQAPVPRTGEVVLPLAALSAPSPASGRALLSEAVSLGYGGDPRPFAGDLVRLLVPPLVGLLDRGLALEAHGQNTLIALRGGRPVRLYYRDFGGVRLSGERLAATGAPVPAGILGDLVSDDPEVLGTKLAAALFGTVLAELAATIDREYGTGPDPVWQPAARALRDAAPGPATAVLRRPTLPVKAMTAMRLAEAPQDDLWTTIPNPMAGHL
jgi:siderophore synthetase component